MKESQMVIGYLLTPILLMGCNPYDDPLHVGIPLVEPERYGAPAPLATNDLIVYSGQVGTKIQETWEGTTYYSWEEVAALEPVVFGSDGKPVPVEPELYRGEVIGWRAVKGFASGHHRVWVGITPAEEVGGFEVGHYGEDEDFDVSAIIGVPFTLNWDWATALNVEVLLMLYVSPIHIEVLGIEDDAVDFRIISAGQSGTCEVLSGVGNMSPGGLLTWNLDQVEAESEPGPIALYDLSLQLGFDSENLAAGGARFEATADLRPFIDLWQEAQLDAAAAGDRDQPVGDELCSVAASAFGGCFECPDDGDPACLTTLMFNGHLPADPDHAFGDLPNCGLQLDEDELPVYGCDIEVPDCSCATGPGGRGQWILWMALCIGGLRRSARTSGVGSL